MGHSIATKVLPKEVLDGIARFIDPLVLSRATKKGVCSTRTARERRIQIGHTMGLLWTLGYKVRKLESLKPKHIDALVSHWDKEGKSASFLHNRLSILRTLGNWMGNPGLVADTADYLPKDRIRRSTVATRDRSWEGNRVPPEEVIEYAKLVDERLAVMLAMQHYFGLRVKESIEIRPSNAVVEGGTQLEIHEGTKGGKPRRIPVQTEAQHETLAWARRVAAGGKTKRLRWPGKTWLQAQRRFYHLLEMHLMLTGDQRGVTAHGLRHGYLQRFYEEASGFSAPIKVTTHTEPTWGGSGTSGKPVPPDGLTRDVHQAACISAARAAGHNRLDVTPSYYGSYGHGLRPEKTADGQGVRLGQP